MSNSELYKKALNYGLRLLLRRNMSSAHISKKLKDKQYASEVIQQVIEQLQDWGYLDDRRYAESYIAAKKLTDGQKKISYSLMKRGIPKNIALEVMQENYLPEEERAALQEVAQKKVTSLAKKHPLNTIAPKLFRFLLGKGFKPSDIKAWITTNLQPFLDNIQNKL